MWKLGDPPRSGSVSWSKADFDSLGQPRHPKGSPQGGEFAPKGGGGGSSAATVLSEFQDIHGFALRVDGDDEKTVLFADKIGASHDDLRERFPGLVSLESQFVPVSEVVISSRELKKQANVEASGVFVYDSRTMYLGSKVTGGRKNLKTGDWVADNSYEGTFRHEYGHALEKAILERAGSKLGHKRLGVGGMLEDVGTDFVKKNVSYYGATNSKEYFAEAFAMYTHPQFDRNKINLGTDMLALFDAALK